MKQFTDEQLQDYQETFSMFDRSNKGYILNCDLREMLKVIGLNPTDRLLEELTITCDVDGDNVFAFEEFLEIIRQIETAEIARKEAQKAFNVFDFLGEGYVLANDVKEALLCVMEKIPELEKINIIRHFRLEKNRKILFEEFYDMITFQSCD